jgi:hypothetical protein
MAKGFAIVLGVVLLVVGLWGLATGGHDHNLIVFGVNAPHNWVHIISGALALVLGLAGEGPARAYCIGFGLVYGLVAVLGFIGLESVVRLLNLNMADNLLHTGIAAACLAVGFGSKPRAA